MRTAWHEILGCGHGPVAGLAPQTRIMAGMLLFAASMVAPATTLPGVAFIAVTAIAWVTACGTPLRMIRSFLLLGLAVFLPYFLLAPILPAEGSKSASMPAIAAPWRVFVHGMAGMLVSTATATTLGPSALRRGMLSLPIPNMVSAILPQIIHQTFELVYETRRVAAAIAIRGGSAGWRNSIRLVSSLPGVWLPRVLIRAERVADAMELRGYCEADPGAFGRSSMQRADAALLTIAIAVLLAAVALRLGETG